MPSVHTVTATSWRHYCCYGGQWGVYMDVSTGVQHLTSESEEIKNPLYCSNHDDDPYRLQHVRLLSVCISPSVVSCQRGNGPTQNPYPSPPLPPHQTRDVYNSQAILDQNIERPTDHDICRKVKYYWWLGARSSGLLTRSSSSSSMVYVAHTCARVGCSKRPTYGIKATRKR